MEIIRSYIGYPRKFIQQIMYPKVGREIKRQKVKQRNADEM